VLLVAVVAPGDVETSSKTVVVVAGDERGVADGGDDGRCCCYSVDGGPRHVSGDDGNYWKTFLNVL